MEAIVPDAGKGGQARRKKGRATQGGAFDGGTAYKISADGTVFTVPHTFSDPSSGSTNGSLPCGPLAFGTGGRLYGLTGVGGETGSGALFKATSDGAKFFMLRDFTSTEGGSARTGLTLGRDGSLYRVAGGGGANGTGTIFRVTLPAVQ